MTDTGSDTHAYVSVLEAEQLCLGELIGGLAVSDWSIPTPAEGWDVRDSLSHLADTSEIAHDTVVGGSRALAVEVARREPDGGVITYGVNRGRVMADPAEVGAWWRLAAGRTVSALRSADTSARVPWGLGMSWRSFVTARLMEHWAHGLDIRAAVGVPAPDTDRLQPIAWLGYTSLPYAFHVDGVVVPEGRSLRVEVTGTGGDLWTFGPEGATDSIRGPAGIWCRRVVQRLTAEEAAELDVDGPLAAMALRHARAFL